MRISQIKTLCWTANALVLAGAGYVGLHFWETYRSQNERPEVKWPREAAKDVIQKRWPGEVTGFQVIWNTPVNGEVPPPPKPRDGGGETRRDPVKEFLQKHQYTANILDLSDPASSIAFVRPLAAKEDVALRTGQEIGGFMLIGFDREASDGTPVLVFTGAEAKDLVRMPMTKEPVPPLVGPPLTTPLVDANDLVQEEITRTNLPRHAYQDLLADPRGLTWRVPPEEVEWWTRFGEEQVLAKLVVNAVEAADGGGARGVRIMSQLGQGTPVGNGRGLSRGDTILAVNGVPVRGKEDILRYLRGEGEGLERYEVLVESENGVERTLVYVVDRRPRRGPSR